MAKQSMYELPTEMWEKVFSYLPTSELLILRLVSKYFSNIVTATKRLENSTISITEENMNQFHDYIRNENCDYGRIITFKNISLNYIKHTDDLNTKILEHVGENVCSVSTTCTRLPIYLHDVFPKLKYLYIGFAGEIKQNLLSLNFNGCTSLTTLHLVNYCDYPNIEFPQLFINLLQCSDINLKDLRLNCTKIMEPALIQLLTKQQHNITSLCIDFTDASCMHLEWVICFEGLLNLRKLAISGLLGKPLQLFTMLSSLPSTVPLEDIEFATMTKLTDTELDLIATKFATTLRSITILHCFGFTNVGLRFLKSCKSNLRIFIVRNCDIDVSDLCGLISEEINYILQELHIVNVKLGHMKLLPSGIEKIPNLRILDLSNNSSIMTDTIVDKICVTQLHLKQLILDDSFKLTNRAFRNISNLRDLELLNICYCKKLSNHFLIEYLKLPNLITLNIGYCHKFTIEGIKYLTENCPSIQNLYAYSCVRLDDECVYHISANLSRLRMLNINNCPKITLKGVKRAVNASITLHKVHAINS